MIKNSPILALAAANPILGRLSPAALYRLLSSGTQVEIASNQALVQQGDDSDCAYLLLSGDFDVQVHTDHGEVTLARISRGAMIGEIGVFANLPRSATVCARSDGCALRLNRSDLLAASDNEPALLQSVISRLGGQIGSFNHAIGIYANAVSALERYDFHPGIMEQLRNPGPELINFTQNFRRMADQILQQRSRHEEMASAAAIQRAMLPNTALEPSLAGQFEIFAQMKPAREVGGDLYDFFALDNDRVVVTIGDVCGKGVPASLFMAVTQTVMRLAIRSSRDLHLGIEAANALLIANNREQMFATLFCVVIEISTSKLTYCNCGHNPPLVLRRGKDGSEPLTASGPPLGVIENATYVERTLQLNTGDAVFLYTDGVTEAENHALDQFGIKRLEDVMTETRGQSARAMVEHAIARVNGFVGDAPQSDDITCLAVVNAGG